MSEETEDFVADRQPEHAENAAHFAGSLASKLLGDRSDLAGPFVFRFAEAQEQPSHEARGSVLVAAAHPEQVERGPFERLRECRGERARQGQDSQVRACAHDLLSKQGGDGGQ